MLLTNPLNKRNIMNSNMEKPYVVGIDIGGTNTVFGIVDARGTIVASGSIKTGAYEKADDYVDEVCKKSSSVDYS